MDSLRACVRDRHCERESAAVIQCAWSLSGLTVPLLYLFLIPALGSVCVTEGKADALSETLVVLAAPLLETYCV